MLLGIEIGGTKLQLGLGDGNGTVHALWRGSVVPANGADGIRRQIVDAIAAFLPNAKLAKAELTGVGIGFGGPVDDATRTVIKSHQIVGWDGFPLADWISDIVGVPGVLGNDADVAGLAEALFGAGKGLSPIFYITIGSGIGGGLIIDSEIFRGCGRGAAEIGHLRVPGLQFEETLEDVASGWGMQRTFAQLTGVADPPSAAEIARQAASGDAAAREVVDLAVDALATAICHVIALLCPRRIVIGGGVSLMGERLLFDPLRTLVAERVFKPFAECCDIVPAALGEEVVVHGALALAREKSH
ncbi:MAG: ROK family protein [Planctomycetes bacterium]|nr:ROK family protein [Planctomycetota bacterium]